MLTEKALPIVLSVFLFSVCTSGAAPFVPTQSESSKIVEKHDITPLTDTYLATVRGGNSLQTSVCNGLLSGANVAFKIGSFFGSSTAIKYGAGLLGAWRVGCAR